MEQKDGAGEAAVKEPPKKTLDHEVRLILVCPSGRREAGTLHQDEANVWEGSSP